MPNTYFQFKQFTINQQHAAMKVCTDACLFGAWAAEKISVQAFTQKENKIQVLDIGTGTGLLSLMLAQKINALYTAVEIDIPAFEEAMQNIAASLWSNRIELIRDDIKTICFSKQFELIISNPPFFEKDLQSIHPKKNTAKHDASLTLQQLLYVIENTLAANGKAAILLPYHRLAECTTLIKSNNFYISHLLNIQQTPHHPFFRFSLIFQKEKTNMLEEKISIRNQSNDYSERFTALLKDYYLHL